MKKLACLLILLVAAPALAGGVARSERKVLLNAVAANAAAGSRTFTLLSIGGGSTKVADGGYNLAVLHFYMNWTATATAVTLVCSASDDGGTTLYTMQSCDVASGVCTSSDSSWVKAISADTRWAWRVDLSGYSYISCVATVTGGAADEAISVSGYLTTK